MGEDSKIQWTDHTFNPWWGCARVSPGCEHCYAEQLATVRRKLPIWGVNAPRRMMSDAHWRQPLGWNRKAAAAKQRARVFCASMSDVLEDRPELVAPRLRLFEVIEKTPWLDWLLLTKRPQNARNLLAEITHPIDGLPANVWVGTTVEDAKRRERLDALRSVPARLRFVSFEPLLEDPGPVNLDGIAWAIIGGESGIGARPCALEWITRLAAQCHAADLDVFVKQLGAHVVSEERRTDGGEWAWRAGLADRKGGDPAEWPDDLRLREIPASVAA